MHRKGSKLLKFIYSEKNLEQNSSIWFNMETVCLPFPGLTAVRRGLLSLICLSYASFSSSFAFSFSIPLVDGQKRPTVCVEMVVDGLCGAPSGVLTGNHEAYKCKYIIMKGRWSKKQTVSQKSINIFCIFNQFYIVCSLLANQRKNIKEVDEDLSTSIGSIFTNMYKETMIETSCKSHLSNHTTNKNVLTSLLNPFLQ